VARRLKGQLKAPAGEKRLSHRISRFAARLPFMVAKQRRRMQPGAAPARMACLCSLVGLLNATSMTAWRYRFAAYRRVLRRPAQALTASKSRELHLAQFAH
jgi:hypothetical protein